MALGDRNLCSISDPPIGCFAVTPSDTVAQPAVVRRFRVSTTAGDVKVTNIDKTTCVIPACQLYEMITGRYTHIWSTDTTAVGITAWY